MIGKSVGGFVKCKRMRVKSGGTDCFQALGSRVYAIVSNTKYIMHKL